MTRYVVIVTQFRGRQRGRRVVWGPWRDAKAATQNATNLRRRKDAAGIEAEVVALHPGGVSARQIRELLS